jgi:hypothetical protein
VGNGLAPSGSVTITINGVSQSATIDSTTGAFSVTFDTSALQVGTYTISFTYAGDSNFTSATGSSTLKVVKQKQSDQPGGLPGCRLEWFTEGSLKRHDGLP